MNNILAYKNKSYKKRALKKLSPPTTKKKKKNSTWKFNRDL